MNLQKCKLITDHDSRILGEVLQKDLQKCKLITSYMIPESLTLIKVKKG